MCLIKCLHQSIASAVVATALFATPRQPYFIAISFLACKLLTLNVREYASS